MSGSRDFCFWKKLRATSTLQNVLTVHTWYLEEPSLSALASKITRQQKNVAPFKVCSIKLQTEKSAEAFKTFMKICPKPV